MRTRIFKNPVTTIAGIIGALIIVAGIIWPDKVGFEEQEALRSATGEILIGVGTLIEVITAILAKDN